MASKINEPLDGVSSRVGQAVEVIVESVGINRAGIAESLGIGSSALSQLTSGRANKPSRKTLRAMEDIYRINPDWILRGEGEMLLDKITAEAAQDNIALGRRLDQLRRTLRLTQEQISAMGGAHRANWSLYENGVRSPTLGIVTALAGKTGVSLQWLLLGEGEIFYKRQPGHDIVKHLESLVAQQSNEISRLLSHPKVNLQEEDFQLVADLNRLSPETRANYRALISAASRRE